MTLLVVLPLATLAWLTDALCLVVIALLLDAFAFTAIVALARA